MIYAPIFPDDLQVPRNVNHGRSEIVELLEGDLYSALPPGLESEIDVIVSNRPTFHNELKGLAPEIVRYEPVGALDGDPMVLPFIPVFYPKGASSCGGEDWLL